MQTSFTGLEEGWIRRSPIRSGTSFAGMTEAFGEFGNKPFGGNDDFRRRWPMILSNWLGQHPQMSIRGKS